MVLQFHSHHKDKDLPSAEARRSKVACHGQPCDAPSGGAIRKKCSSMCFIGAGDIYLSLVASWCRGTGTGAGSVRRATRDAGRPGGDGQGGWPRVSRPDGGRGEDGDPRAGASPMCRRAYRSGRPLPGRMRQDEEARVGATDWGVSLPTACHVTPELEPWATGTSRSLSATRSRSYADEFSRGALAP